VFDYRGYQIGENLKTVVGAKPKTVVYPWSANVPLLHYPLGVNVHKKVVLVEDQISAIKLSLLGESFTPVALMGTYLTYEGLMQLINTGVTEALVFLDGDAILKATELYNKLSNVFTTRIVVIGPKLDPKDLSADELRGVLN
jgi:hypothetical protein